MVRYLIDLLILGLLVTIGWIVVSGGQVIDLGWATLSLRHIKNPFILLSFFLMMRLLVFPTRFWLMPRHALLFSALKSVIFLSLSIISVKTIVSLLDRFYFHRPLNFVDWVHTYSIDLTLVFFVSTVLLVLGLFCLIRRGKQRSDSVMEQTPHKTTYVLLTWLVWLSTTSGAFYVLLGYTYFEWGSFIEPHHVQAINMAGVGPEFTNLLLRSYTLATLVWVLALYLLASKIVKILQSYRLNPLFCIVGLLFLLMPALLSYSSPLSSPALFAPTVQSPLLMLMNPIADNSDGFEDTERLMGIDITGYAPYQIRGVKPQHADLSGVAKGYNVVFYVMESVRRQNLRHYGYHRETMPTLTELIRQSLVFDNAYVMQPRSSKVMSALALGIMPDPRLRPLSWNPERIAGEDTLFKRLIADNRRFYIGTAQPYGGDNLQQFFIEAAGKQQQLVISHEDLVKDTSLENDDVGLSEHFNRWVSSDDQPFVGLLWTECAHMPYTTEKAPFGLQRLIDKYDNCLNHIDRGLNELLEGLKKNGQLNNTLLVVFGDHGEALGEKFDRGHGSYLYEHSMRVPFFISNPKLFPQSQKIEGRFQLKDVPATVLWMLGLPSSLNQSENIFSKSRYDPVYMSNVYQDFKMGIIEGNYKYIYRPRFDMSFYYDLQEDPQEYDNIVSQLGKEDLLEKQETLLKWYKYQTQYVERQFPDKK